MPRYVWMYPSMREHVFICLNSFCFIFLHCNQLSNWTRGHLYQRLHKSRCFSIHENEPVFLGTQNLIFSIVAVSILFCFCFRLNILINKFSNLMLTLGAEGGRGCKSWHIHLSLLLLVAVYLNYLRKWFLFHKTHLHILKKHILLTTLILSLIQPSTSQ